MEAQPGLTREGSTMADLTQSHSAPDNGERGGLGHALSTAISKPVNILIRLSGARPALLESPGERAGYAALGLSMLIVAAVQFMSARIFLTLFLDGRALGAISGGDGGSGAAALMRNLGYSPAAAVWALLVYALELSITSQITGTEPTQEVEAALTSRGRLRGRWGRVGLSIAFGVVISEMIAQLLFASSFTTLVEADHAKENARALAVAKKVTSGAVAAGIIGPNGKPVGAYAELLGARNELAAKTNEARQRYACEQNGNVSSITSNPDSTVDCKAYPGTGRPGYENIAAQRQQEYTDARNAQSTWENAHGSELTSFIREAGEVEKGSAATLEDEQASIARDDGFGPRVDASIDYLRSRPWTRIPARLALLAAGVLLDLVPMIIKSGLAGSVYDVRQRRMRRAALLDEIDGARAEDNERRRTTETREALSEERDRRSRAQGIALLELEFGDPGPATTGQNGGTRALPDLSRGARVPPGALAPLAARTRRHDPVTGVARPLADPADRGPYAGRIFQGSKGRRFQAGTKLSDEQQGSYGTVYVGKEIGGENILVAIKIIDPKRANSEPYKVAFRRETAPRRAHPGLAPLLGHGRLPDGARYSIIPWYQDTLADWYAKNRDTLTISTIVRVAAEIADGLAALSPSVHNDAHPRNVAINDARAVVFDFGLTRLPPKLRSMRLPSSFAPAGTLYFSAPERLFDGDAGDETTEVYSLYALVYWCLVGVPPLALDAEDAGVNMSFEHEVRQYCLRPYARQCSLTHRLPGLPPELYPLADLVDRRLSHDRIERVEGLRSNHILEDACAELTDVYAHIRGIPAGHLLVGALAPERPGHDEATPDRSEQPGMRPMPFEGTVAETTLREPAEHSADAEGRRAGAAGSRPAPEDDVPLAAAAGGIPGAERTSVEALEPDGPVTPSLTLVPGGIDGRGDGDGPVNPMIQIDRDDVGDVADWPAEGDG